MLLAPTWTHQARKGQRKSYMRQCLHYKNPSNLQFWNPIPQLTSVCYFQSHRHTSEKTLLSITFLSAMADQRLELALVNLKGDIKPTDSRLLSVFRTCLDELSKGGGTHFRFLTSSPTGNLDETIVMMIGIWPTDELHAKFIDSGILMPLMASLQDLISMREVVYLKVPELTPAQNEVLEGDLVTGFFHVEGKEHDNFGKAAEEVLGGRKECVIGWNSTQGESFQKSEEFRKGRLEQASSDIKHDGVWGVLLKKENTSVLGSIQAATEKKFERADVRSWDGLDC